MKALTCEMCGSTNLIKDGGVFVCQSCGTKYSLEEAKKMMVEGTVDVKGTVKVDVSDELKNLYELARRARENNNSENAMKFYDQILVKDPQNWEANFYSVYYKAMSCRIAEIESAGDSVANCLDSVYNLIKSNVTDEDEQKVAVLSVAADSMHIAEMLYGAATSHYNGIDAEIQGDYLQEYINNCCAAQTIMEVVANGTELYFGGDNYGVDVCVPCWERAIEMRNELIPYLNDKEGNKNLLHTWGDKIKKYKPEYVVPEIKQASGCYIATAVYGSYDCPQVWTLRRFRDYTLDETWYGRLFIKTYYAISPTLVDWFGETNWFKAMWRRSLDRLVENLRSRGFEDTKYTDKY